MFILPCMCLYTYKSIYEVLYWLLVSCVLELPHRLPKISAGSACYTWSSNASPSFCPEVSGSNFPLLPCGEWLPPNPIFGVLSKRLKNCFSHTLLSPDPFSILVSTVFPFLSALGVSWKIGFLTPLPWSPCCQALSLPLKCWAPFPSGWRSPFFFLMCFWPLSASGCYSPIWTPRALPGYLPAPVLTRMPLSASPRAADNNQTICKMQAEISMCGASQHSGGLGQSLRVQGTPHPPLQPPLKLAHQLPEKSVTRGIGALSLRAGCFSSSGWQSLQSSLIFRL